jgi:AcrR family transcriptional regulator
MQMRTVAERAGVALGTLYRYFPSKMDLVVAVVSEELDLLESSIERRPPSAATPAGRAVDVLMRATRGLMREPELADALIRSLIMADVEVPFGDRMAGLLLRVSADGLTVEQASEEQYALVGSLAAIWVQELLEMLRGRRTYEQIQRRIEIAAARLLADF